MILKRLSAAMVGALLVTACAPVARSTPSTAPSSSGQTSSTSAAPVASASSLPSKAVAVEARALGWVDVGEVRAKGVDVLLALNGGYLGWEASGEAGYPVASYSSDGLTWTQTDLAREVTPCPGWTARPDGEVSAGATNGKAVVLVGLEYDPKAASCGTWQAAAWVTTDGTSWQRAQGFAPAVDGNAWSENVWATPDGWEAAVTSPNTITIWQSSDGLTWTAAAQLGKGDVRVGAHASAADGTRLLVINDESAETSRLLTSKDGRDWREVAGPALAHGGIAPILAPGPDSRLWIFVAPDAGETSTIWTSTDLEHWESARFPMPAVESIAHTAYGLLALGSDPCGDVGGTCATEPSQYFLSSDGRTWTPLNAVVDAVAFIEGGAGVIGIGYPKPGETVQHIWRLEPYSADEAVLFTGLRPDARIGCSARRTDLPAHAVAGIECAPQLDGIDRIGAYRFASQDELLDTYFKRLADNGVKPRSGSCPQHAGEVSYLPGDDGATVGAYRYGCYLNEFGVANYRYTDPDYLVYVGILGTGKDLERLHDWAWRGNQDVPGGPTVWRGNAYGP